jgi:pre-mRNA-processing factor 40
MNRHNGILPSWMELYPAIRELICLVNLDQLHLTFSSFLWRILKHVIMVKNMTLYDILKNKGFVVEVNTTFEGFVAIISSSLRSSTLGTRNSKLAFSSLLEKAEV